jgi:hypothetical protein
MERKFEEFVLNPTADFCFSCEIMWGTSATGSPHPGVAPPPPANEILGVVHFLKVFLLTFSTLPRK